MALLLVIALMLGALALVAMGMYVIAIPLALIGAAAFIATNIARGEEGAPQVVGEAPEPTGVPRSATDAEAATANERVGQA